MGNGDVEIVYAEIPEHEKINLEKHLLLSLKQFEESVPAKWKYFSAFVVSKFGNRFPKEVMKSVWRKLKNLEDFLSGKEPVTIEISSDEEDSKKSHGFLKVKDLSTLKGYNGPYCSDNSDKPPDTKIQNNEKGNDLTKTVSSKTKKSRSRISKDIEKIKKSLKITENLNKFLDTSMNPGEVNIDTNGVVEVDSENSGKKRKRKKNSQSCSAEGSMTDSPGSGRKIEITEKFSEKKKRKEKTELEEDVEELRRNLLIDKLIEISLPELLSSPLLLEKSAKKKKKRNSI